MFSELLFEVQLDEEDAHAQRGLSSSARGSKQFSSVQGLMLDGEKADAPSLSQPTTNSSTRGSRLVSQASSVQGSVENQRLSRFENAMWE